MKMSQKKMRNFLWFFKNLEEAKKEKEKEKEKAKANPNESNF